MDPVAAVEELLELLPVGTTRLLGFGLRRAGGRPVPAPTDAKAPQLVSRIRTQLAAAARRAGLDPAALGVDGCGSGLSDTDTGWLLAHLNPSVVRQLRDLTYALLGAATASRHAGLAALQIRDLEATDSGWDVRFRQEKNNPEGVEELVRGLNPVRNHRVGARLLRQVRRGAGRSSGRRRDAGRVTVRGVGAGAETVVAALHLAGPVLLHRTLRTQRATPGSGMQMASTDDQRDAAQGEHQPLTALRDGVLSG